MRSKIITTSDLVTALDDSRWLYNSMNASVVRPSLKRLLAGLTQLHQRIADELCEAIVVSGGSVSRKGRAWWFWRATWLRLLTRCSSHSELACTIQTKQCESRLLQRFRSALQQTRDLETHACLVVHSYELEFAQVEIDRFLSQMEIQAGLLLIERHTSRRVPTPVAVQQPPTQERGRFGSWHQLWRG